MPRSICLLVVLAAWVPPLRAQSTATLKGFDAYRSEVLSKEKLQAVLGPRLETYIDLRNKRTPLALRRAEALKAQIEDSLKEMAPLAYARMYHGEYFTSAQHAVYVTFDIVDAKDAKTRLAFKAAPRGRAMDPEGLVAAWIVYDELGSTLSKRGEMPFDRPSCPTFYCRWAAVTPELQKFETRFFQGVGPNKKHLLNVLAMEADPRKRAAAAYLLSYLSDGREVSRIMADVLQDPDDSVRAAALQVFSDLSVYHNDIPLPVEKIVKAVDDPATSDRAAALGVLVGMSGNSSYREAVLLQASPYLIGLLKLQQPSNHDLAFTLLGILSGENFDRRDYKSWENWLSRRKSGRQ